MNKPSWLVAALTGLMTGCGGVYVEHSHVEPLAGVYDGFVDDRFAHALIAEDGRTAFYLPETGEIYNGHLYSAHGEVYGDLTRYRQIQGSSHSSQAVAAEHGSFDAVHVDGELIDAQFESPQSLRYADLYLDGATSFSGFLPQGRFEATDFVIGFDTRISLDFTGRIEGDDSAGCLYDGHLHNGGSINARSLRLTVDCPSYEWTGDGVATIFRTGGRDVLLLSAGNAQHAYATELLR